MKVLKKMSHNVAFHLDLHCLQSTHLLDCIVSSDLIFASSLLLFWYTRVNQYFSFTRSVPISPALVVLIVVIPLYSGGFSQTHVYKNDGIVHYRLFEAIARTFQISKYVLHIIIIVT